MRALFALALALTFLSSGCAGWRRPAVPVVRLGISPDVAAGSPASTDTVVEIAAFATAPAFRTDRVAVAEGGSGYRFLTRVRWAAEPGPLVADALRRGLIGSGAAKAAFAAPAPVSPDLRCTGVVDALYWDRSRGVVVLGATWSLIGPDGELESFRSGQWEVPVDPATLQGFQTAADRVVARLVGSVAKDLARLARE
ncbi:ABC-type transport auxiliary lipoprotein family protein [Deferrisoma camini]|uniref:ABC-type transport auxiliary lipoprotein family protein n=1 Tax=Deferrisoma camini TaxID=1035120 RepID=UPI00046CD52E|nr:ABC-type transport auxiliary lipoprotein family protein [Deferrisoma camini]